MVHDELVSAGVHIGLKEQTKDMKRFVYKIRNDGLAVFDLQNIAKRIEIAGKFLSKFNSIMVVSRKAVAHKAIRKFAEAVGAQAITGRFLPGTITNPSFRGYREPEVVVVTDPLADKQAMKEAMNMRLPIISLCDTFNETGSVDLVIPCNNMGRKAVGMVYFSLAKEIMKTKGQDASSLKLEEFFVPEERQERMERTDRPERRDRMGRGGRSERPQRRMPGRR
ncbi:MAG TPA: 30S ribosomal protein S2 [archaeon]|nr:30S ribosomal protein S2 [archaeon]